MDDPVRVQVLERQDHLGQVEPRRVLCERSLFAQVREELAARLVVHHEVHLYMHSCSSRASRGDSACERKQVRTLDSDWNAYVSLITNGWRTWWRSNAHACERQSHNTGATERSSYLCHHVALGLHVVHALALDEELLADDLQSTTEPNDVISSTVMNDCHTTRKGLSTFIAWTLFVVTWRTSSTCGT